MTSQQYKEKLKEIVKSTKSNSAKARLLMSYIKEIKVKARNYIIWRDEILSLYLKELGRLPMNTVDIDTQTLITELHD